MRVAVPNVRCMTAIDRLQELTRPTGEEDLMAVRYPKPRLSVPVKPAAAVVVALLVAGGAWAATRGGGDAGERWSGSRSLRPLRWAGLWSWPWWGRWPIRG